MTTARWLFNEKEENRQKLLDIGLVNSIIHILANKLYKVNCKTVRLA